MREKYKTRILNVKNSINVQTHKINNELCIYGHQINCWKINSMNLHMNCPVIRQFALLLVLVIYALISSFTHIVIKKSVNFFFSSPFESTSFRLFFIEQTVKSLYSAEKWNGKYHLLIILWKQLSINVPLVETLEIFGVW